MLSLSINFELTYMCVHVDCGLVAVQIVPSATIVTISKFRHNIFSATGSHAGYGLFPTVTSLTTSTTTLHFVSPHQVLLLKRAFGSGSVR